LVGTLAAIMGVGGGFLMVPMMVYLLGMPMHAAIGTDLFQIFFTCIGVTFMQATTNQTVDLVLALPLAAGSAIGAQMGARVSRYLRGEQLRILLALLVLLVTAKMLSGLVFTPGGRLRRAGDHFFAGLSHPAHSHPADADLLRRTSNLLARGHDVDPSSCGWNEH
jgi:hypothetical protein